MALPDLVFSGLRMGLAWLPFACAALCRARLCPLHWPFLFLSLHPQECIEWQGEETRALKRRGTSWACLNDSVVSLLVCS